MNNPLKGANEDRSDIQDIPQITLGRNLAEKMHTNTTRQVNALTRQIVPAIPDAFYLIQAPHIIVRQHFVNGHIFLKVQCGQIHGPLGH